MRSTQYPSLFFIQYSKEWCDIASDLGFKYRYTVAKASFQKNVSLAQIRVSASMPNRQSNFSGSSGCKPGCCRRRGMRRMDLPALLRKCIGQFGCVPVLRNWLLPREAEERRSPAAAGALAGLSLSEGLKRERLLACHSFFLRPMPVSCCSAGPTHLQTGRLPHQA